MAPPRLHPALRMVPPVHGEALAIVAGASALTLGIVGWLALWIHPGWGLVALLPVAALWRHVGLAGGRDTPPAVDPCEPDEPQIAGGFVIAGMAYVKTLDARGLQACLVTSSAVGEGTCRRLRIFLRHRSEA